MKMRRCVGLVLALAVVASSLSTPVFATEASENVEPISEIERASGKFSTTIQPGKTNKIGSGISLEAGETVTFNASYSPRSASVDFGLVDSNNVFIYINVSAGSVDGGVTVTTRGKYTPAIRNNSSNQVDVSGFVEC